MTPHDIDQQYLMILKANLERLQAKLLKEQNRNIVLANQKLVLRETLEEISDTLRIDATSSRKDILNTITQVRAEILKILTAIKKR